MIIRKMQPTELDITVNLCGYYADEAKIPAEEYDTDSVVDSIRMYTIQPEYVWYNAYENTRPVGFIAGCLTQKLWTKDQFIGHIDFVYLLDSHRTLDNFRRLVAEFEQWALMMKCTEVTAGDLGVNLERTEKLYEHLGYKRGLWVSKEISE
jgi:GNAT superfamily N-acetyltransferase